MTRTEFTKYSASEIDRMRQLSCRCVAMGGAPGEELRQCQLEEERLACVFHAPQESVLVVYTLGDY